MAHIGVLTLGVPGHLNPLSCLGRALEETGHRVTFFQNLDHEEAVRRTGLGFVPVGEQIFPRGHMAEHYVRLGSLHGMAALRYTIETLTKRSRMFLSDGPVALEREGIDLLLVDQVEPAGACVAERLGLPFITVSVALVLNREPGIPPIFTTWPYSRSWWARVRNGLASRMQTRLVRSWLAVLNEQRREWGLKVYRAFEDATSPWAHLSQQPACFDFPREDLPDHFHYTGPWHDRRFRPVVPFPWEKLHGGRPLIYASMGTLQNRIAHVFREIAAACEGLDADLVISLGGGSAPEQIEQLPGSPLVTGYAPQLELLSRAALAITHAGLNTALESLSAGVPMVAIPVGNDQPGVAARLKGVGVAEILPFQRLRSDRLRPLVRKVLGNAAYRERAQALGAEIRENDGVAEAVRIVQGVLGERRPASMTAVPGV
jgi:zeaxanthin glucosyltransferase